MKIQNLFFFSILSFLVFGSCQQSSILNDEALSHIPNTTSNITAINIQRMMDKADFKEVVKMSFYQDMIEEVERNAPSIVPVLNDPYSSGIDLKSNAYFIQDVNTSGQTPFSALIANVQDKAAFEKLISSQKNIDIQQGENFQFAKPERGAIIAWNEKIAVFGGGNSRLDLKGKVNELFNVEKGNSIVGNKDLQKCLSKNSDIAAWFGSDDLAETAAKEMGMALAMAGFSKDMLKGNYAHSYFNFEDGEVASNSTYTINPKLADELGPIFKNEVGTDFSKFLPNDNLAFAFSGGLSVDGINDLVKKRGADALADGQLREFGITTEDIANALDGDILVAGFHNPNSKEPIMVFGIKIKNRKDFNKFVDLAIEFEVMNKINDNVFEIRNYQGNDDFLGGSPQLVIADDIAFFGGDQAILSQIQNGGFSKAERINGKAKDILKNNIMGAYMNFENISKFNLDEDFDLNELEDGFIRFDKNDASFKLEMTDKSMNSLKKIFQWINKSYEKNQAKKSI